MKISIAMTTYNGERFIREQLASLAAQTLQPCELVVGDDGSTDRTLEILAQFAAEVPFPVRVQRNTQRYGFSDNFLHTARRCTGDWIAFCDQDDIWLPHKLQCLAEIVARNPQVVFCAHRATIIDENAMPHGEISQPAVERLTIFPSLAQRLWTTPLGFTELFHSSLIREFPFEGKPQANHDRWVFWLANVVGHTAFVPDRLALYRRHQQNESNFTQNPELTAQLADTAGSAQYEAASRTEAALAVYLAAQVPRLSGDLLEYVERGAKIHARLADRFRKRAVIWDASYSPSTRFVSWVRLVATGGYGTARAGGVGWKSAGKDFARLVWFKTRRAEN